MRCIIIEDQAPAQQILQRYISNTSGLKLEMTFSDAIKAETYMKNQAIDLIFLDIDLPCVSGLDFLRSVQGYPLTIITTAYSEHALESYQFNVVDYLLKPFSFERFSRAIEKVNTMTWSIKKIEPIPELPSDRSLYVKTGHNLVKISKDDIIYIKSDGDYTEIVTASNKYLTSDSLKEWVAKLDDEFKQVHKSYIANTRNLTKISHNKIYLGKDQVIPIGRAFKKHFIENEVKSADF